MKVQRKTLKHVASVRMDLFVIREEKGGKLGFYLFGAPYPYLPMIGQESFRQSDLTSIFTFQVITEQ